MFAVRVQNMVTNIHTLRINTKDLPAEMRKILAKRAQESAERNGSIYLLFNETPFNEILSLKNLGINHHYKHSVYIQLSLF